MKEKKNLRVIGWILSIIWCGIIFFINASPTATSVSTASLISDNSNFSTETVSSLNYVIRKIAHMTLFGVLAILLVCSTWKIRHSYLIAWILTTIYGALDEIHQIFTPNRTPSIIDVGIDSLGAFLALVLLWRVQQKNSKVI